MRNLLLFTLLLLCACSSGKKTLQTGNVDLIILERTPCYGTCPSYVLTVHGDGEVEYEGRRFVDNIGMHIGNVDPSIVQALFKEAASLDWESFPEVYPIDNVDFPQFKLTYTFKGQTYHVKGNSRAASELIVLSKNIDVQLETISLLPKGE